MTAISNVRQLPQTIEMPKWLTNALLVVGASLLISLFAHIAIYLPFTPVPLALQMNVCLFLAMVLGSKRAALAVMLFLLQGALGLPVLATGGAGLVKFFGPTGGYLLGYIGGAYLTGYLWEKTKNKTASQAFLAMAAGNLVVFVLGVVQLSQFIGFPKALLLGVAPFIIGDIVKHLLSVRVLKSLKLLS